MREEDATRRFVRIGSTEQQNGRRVLAQRASSIGEESPPRIREYEEDDDEEEKAFAEREKKFTLQRKLFRESLKMKNLERANGFTRKNLDLSASSRDESRGRGCDDGRRRRCPAGVEVVGTMRGRYGRKGETGDVVVAFADRERRRRISRDGGGEVTTRHLRESVYDRKIRRVVARSGVESGQKRRSRIRQTNGGTKDGNRRVHRGIRVFERVRRRTEDNDGDSFSSRNSDNSTRTRISGNTGKVLKRADVAAIAGLLSLGETLVTIDFSRDREMTKEKLRQSIKAFVDARRQAQTVKDYAEAWTVVDAIVTNGVNSLDRLVDVVSSRKNRNDDDDFSKKLKSFSSRRA